jgi:adenylate cyclase
MSEMIGKTILHYKITDKLGEGGMGVVYKAEDSKLKREVAIKFLPHHISANKEERQRFEIEAQAAAALNHPNITTIFAIEESDDPQGGREVFIVMEYIEGKELKSYVETGNAPSLPLNDAINYIEQIAKGLQAAHQKGIIHRDIKSSNIMITKSGQVKVMDFGLAKVGGTSNITKFGTTLGTTAYMSPEQARGEHVDLRTDIWSLGVVFYEMLTGKMPFRGEFEQAVIYSILNEEPEQLIALKKDLPIKLDQIIAKMLSKNPTARYQNIDELLRDLRKEKGQKQEESEEKKTIAVLPFENIGSDKETDYFADGLAEELIINLSKLKDVRTVSRTNSMRYKGTEKDIRTIGRELGARYVMEGSVRKFRDDLRITTQLIDVAEGLQLWGETYKGKLADVFDIQEKLSKEIVDALSLKLSPTEKIVLEKRATLNTEAYDLYLRARNFLYKVSKNNVQFAIQLFKKVIDIDARYAAGYAGLSESYATQYYYFEKDEQLLDKAIDAGLRALMYDPTLSEAYAALALSYYNKKLRDEAFTAGQKAIELDPNNYYAYWILGRIFHSTDRDEQAAELHRKVIEINPDFYAAYSDLSVCYERLGEKSKHEETLKTLMEVYPRYLMQNPDDARAHIVYAIDLVKVGKIEEAKAEGKRAVELSPDDSLMSYNVACLYSRLDDKKSGIEYLSKAIHQGYTNFEWLKRDPDLENIRNEPEYIELMKGK